MALTVITPQDGEVLRLGTFEERAVAFYDVSANALILQTPGSDLVLVDRISMDNDGLANFSGGVVVSGATLGLGYATGAGGTVTQNTNKSTGVTLNTVTGIVTMNNAALAADTTVAFTLTDSAIDATDAVVVVHESGGTIGAYSFGATGASGSVVISVHNLTPGSLSEAIVLRFVVIKSVNA